MKDRKSVRGGGSMHQEEIGTVPGDASLGSEIQGKIGEQLRAFYDDVVNQGVPDRFADLLRRLDEQGRDHS